VRPWLRQREVEWAWQVMSAAWLTMWCDAVGGRACRDGGQGTVREGARRGQSGTGGCEFEEETEPEVVSMEAKK
jgi:hypothetical protein